MQKSEAPQTLTANLEPRNVSSAQLPSESMRMRVASLEKKTEVAAQVIAARAGVQRQETAAEAAVSRVVQSAAGTFGVEHTPLVCFLVVEKRHVGGAAGKKLSLHKCSEAKGAFAGNRATELCSSMALDSLG